MFFDEGARRWKTVRCNLEELSLTPSYYAARSSVKWVLSVPIWRSRTYLAALHLEHQIRPAHSELPSSNS